MTRLVAGTRYLIIIPIIGLGLAAAAFFCVWRFFADPTGHSQCTWLFRDHPSGSAQRRGDTD